MIRRPSRWRDERGIALIIVLLVTTVLTVLVLDLHQSVRIHFYIANNLTDGIKAAYLVRSGIQVAAGALLKDMQDNKTDHWHEDWYDFLGKAGMPAMPVAENELLMMEINDESGRFDLNQLVNKRGEANQQMVDVFVQLLTDEDIDPQLAHAVVDYIDVNEETFDHTGMEDQVYGYAAYQDGTTSKNSRFESLQEVRLVMGITDEIWNKLEPLVTIYGDPKMNLNTVHPKIIRAVVRALDPNADVTIADKIDQWRKQSETSSSDEGEASFAGFSAGEGNHFTNKNLAKQLGEIGMDPKLTAKFSKLFGASSHFFRVTATAIVHNVQKSALGVVFRYKKKASVIYYRVAPGVAAGLGQGQAEGEEATPAPTLPPLG
jgi:general secretion pathway protein K